MNWAIFRWMKTLCIKYGQKAPIVRGPFILRLFSIVGGKEQALFTGWRYHLKNQKRGKKK